MNYKTIFFIHTLMEEQKNRLEKICDELKERFDTLGNADESLKVEILKQLAIASTNFGEACTMLRDFERHDFK